jgi:succinate dehydrogenase hydrophobic anchor subunit
MSSNDEKLAFIRAVGQVVMSWIAFIVTGLVTLFFLAFFVYCVVKDRGPAAASITAVLDGFMLILLQIIYKSLFPGDK